MTTAKNTSLPDSSDLIDPGTVPVVVHSDLHFAIWWYVSLSSFYLFVCFAPFTLFLLFNNLPIDLLSGSFFVLAPVFSSYMLCRYAPVIIFSCLVIPYTLLVLYSLLILFKDWVCTLRS